MTIQDFKALDEIGKGEAVLNATISLISLVILNLAMINDYKWQAFLLKSYHRYYGDYLFIGK